MVGFNNYQFMSIIIYTNFVVQTVKNSNPLQVFCENVLLSGILYNVPYLKLCQCKTIKQMKKFLLTK